MRGEVYDDMAFGVGSFKSEGPSYPKFTDGEHIAIRWACRDLVENLSGQDYEHRLHVLYDLLNK